MEPEVQQVSPTIRAAIKRRQTALSFNLEARCGCGWKYSGGNPDAEGQSGGADVAYTAELHAVKTGHSVSLAGAVTIPVELSARAVRATSAKLARRTVN